MRKEILTSEFEGNIEIEMLIAFQHIRSKYILKSKFEGPFKIDIRNSLYRNLKNIVKSSF